MVFFQDAQASSGGPEEGNPHLSVRLTCQGKNEHFEGINKLHLETK